MNCAICSVMLRALKGVMPESIVDISRRMAPMISTPGAPRTMLMSMPRKDGSA